MLTKLYNVNEYHEFDLSKSLVLHGKKLRRVRLELIASDPVRVSLLKGTLRNELVFLANVDGQATIDFMDEGNIHIVCNALVDHDDVSVRYFTNDGEAVHSDAVDRTVFTKMHSRRPRNPELEYIQQKMLENNNRLFAKIERDAELRDRQAAKRIAALETQLTKVKPDADTSREAPDAPSGQAPKPDAKPGDKPSKPKAKDAEPETE